MCKCSGNKNFRNIKKTEGFEPYGLYGRSGPIGPMVGKRWGPNQFNLLVRPIMPAPVQSKEQPSNLNNVMNQSTTTALSLLFLCMLIIIFIVFYNKKN